MALDLEDKPGYQNDGLDKKPGNDGEHDDLGVHPERREAEVADLEDAFSSPSAEKPDTPASSPEELKTQEEKSGSSQDSDQIGEGYKGNDRAGGVRKLASKFSGISTRKKVISGSVIGVIIGSFSIFSILQGPMQLKHLSEILKKNGWSSDHTSSKRLGSSYRYMRSGSVGETRIGAIGSRIQSNTRTKLAQIGISFQDSARTGQITRFDFDAAKHPEFKGLSASESRNNLSKMIGVPESSIKQITGLREGKFYVETRKWSITELRSLTDISLRQLNNGKIATSLRGRTMAKFHNNPSMFHPLKRLESKIQRSIDNRIYYRQLEKKRRNRIKPKISQKAQDAKKKINKALDGKRRALAAALIATESMCLVRKLASTIPVVNYGYVVTPSSAEAMDIISLGDQLGSGSDFTSDQIGARIAGFTDESGDSIWGAKSLNALANNDAGRGTDIPIDYKQSFTPMSNEEVIKNIIKKPSWTGGGVVGDILCSKTGLVIQGLAGIALTFFSGGTWTAGRVVTTAGQIAITGAAVGFLMERAVDHFTQDPVKAFSGPLGGNMMAYGARAAYNTIERSSGGVELDRSEELALLEKQKAEETRQFQQKSFFARMFDVNDSRSLLASTIIQTPLPSVSGISNIASSFLKPFGTLLSSFSWLTAKTYAVEEPYDWGFPKYGIPQSIIDNPKYEDSFENAEKSARIFEDEAKRRTEFRPYTNKARACFGVTISKGSEGWDAVPVEDVNPAEEGYRKKNCADLSDENWVRVMLFVYDTRLLTSVDCYDGGEASCSQLGFSSSQTPSTPSTPTGSAIVGDIGESSADVACAEGTVDKGTIETLYSGAFRKSVPLVIRLCQIPDLPGRGINAEQANDGGGAIVNSRVSGAWLALVKAAKADGVELKASSSFRYAHSCGGGGDGVGCATPGGSPHQMGVAIDFSNMGEDPASDRTCTNRQTWDSDGWRWLRDNASRYGFKQYSNEAWHWDPVPMSNRC